MSSDNPGSERGGAASLRDLKRQLRGRYLGKYGIHGLGARFSEDAICVYLRPGAEQQDAALGTLRQEVAPHKLIVIEEQAPRLS